jgi:gas vesicle structural protein
VPRRRSDAEKQRGAAGAVVAADKAVLDSSEASLLDIVDNVLNKGVVLSGDLTIALAQVDLIYARLSVLLCAADRVLPNEDTDFIERHHARRKRRAAVRLRHGDGETGPK